MDQAVHNMNEFFCEISSLRSYLSVHKMMSMMMTIMRLMESLQKLISVRFCCVIQQMSIPNEGAQPYPENKNRARQLLIVHGVDEPVHVEVTFCMQW